MQCSMVQGEGVVTRERLENVSKRLRAFVRLTGRRAEGSGKADAQPSPAPPPHHGLSPIAT